jgi:hypothetical protein
MEWNNKWQYVYVKNKLLYIGKCTIQYIFGGKIQSECVKKIKELLVKQYAAKRGI